MNAKRIIRNGVVMAVCVAAVLPVSTASANDIEDFFKRAHRSMAKRHKEVLRAHVGAASVAAAMAPRLRSVDIRVGSVPHGINVRAVPNRQHICRKIRVKTWVSGYWQQTVQQRWVSYRHRHGGHYEDVVVKHWVPGHHEYSWQIDSNCSCRAQSRSGHRGSSARGNSSRISPYNTHGRGSDSSRHSGNCR